MHTMTEILSVTSQEGRSKRLLKAIHRVPRFYQLAGISMLLIIFATPIIVNNSFDVRQHAAVNEIIVGSGGYPTIPSALQAATNGAVIKIKAGVYTGKIMIDKSVTLEPYGDGDVWIDAGCVATYPADNDTGIDNAIAISSSNVTIRGLKIRNSRDGAILVDGRQASSVAYVTIDSNYIENFDCQSIGPQYRAGIAVWQANNGMVITNNTIVGKPGNSTYRGGGNGIWFKSHSQDPSGGGHRISGNIIRGVYDGIGGEKEDDPRGSFDRDTIIENNTISYCYDDGIQTEGGTKNIHVRNNRIDHCAIGIANAPNLIGPIYFENNTITDSMPGFYGNMLCFKVGNYQPNLIPPSEVGPENGRAYYTGNSCTITGDGWGQTNAPVASIISRNNSLKTGRYVIEINSPAPGAVYDFDYDCLYTTDSTRFVEFPTGKWYSFKDFQTLGKQEANGISHTSCGNGVVTPSVTPSPTAGTLPTNTPTPTPTRIPTPTPTKMTATPTNKPTSTPTAVPVVKKGIQTLTFDLLSGKELPLNTIYPENVLNWGINTWYLSGPYKKFKTKYVTFYNSSTQQASFTFLIPAQLVQVDALNADSSGNATVSLSCPGQPTVTTSIGRNSVKTIKTNWTGTCSTVTLSSTRGYNRDAGFDNFVIDVK